MKKILFITLPQFGYDTDMYNMSKLLSDEYHIYFLCYNRHLDIIPNDKVRVMYIDNYKKGIMSKLLLVKKSIEYAVNNDIDIVFVLYFPGCSLLNLFIKKRKMIVNVRTGSVEPKKIRRLIMNKLITFESKRFPIISIISNSLMELLKLNIDKSFILPLGANTMIKPDDKATKIEMSLLYVGIFEQRKIEDTIIGFINFYKKYHEKINCKYTIIGYSSDKDTEERLVQLINKVNIKGAINFIGRVPNNQLDCYFKTHNIGVSYVPITEYYDVQPPTKTFEYILNGLICLATKTKENCKVINCNNGVLIGEGAKEVTNGLEIIYNNLHKYNIKDIMDTGQKYTWDYIVNKILRVKLQELTKHERTNIKKSGAPN